VNTLDQALALWRCGLNVLDVPRPDAARGHDGKRTIRPWRQWQTERQVEADIHEMFNGDPMNLAIITGGPSEVVGIDADSVEGLRHCTKRLPYTPWQVKSARGWHLYYRHPGVSVPNRARLQTLEGRLAVDVRGDGGYLLAPPSVHATGVLYEFAGDWSVPKSELPRFWPGWLQRPERPTASRPSTPRPTGDVVERARRYLAAVPRPEIGAGSDAATLYAACRLVRGFGLETYVAVDLLWEWAGGRSGWTREWIVQKVQHAERYGTEPIGALR